VNGKIPMMKFSGEPKKSQNAAPGLLSAARSRKDLLKASKLILELPRDEVAMASCMADAKCSHDTTVESAFPNCAEPKVDIKKNMMYGETTMNWFTSTHTSLLKASQTERGSSLRVELAVKCCCTS
jgi:hypothetical protein